MSATAGNASGSASDGEYLRPLRAAALIATVAGGVGSVGLMLHAGKQTPRLLLWLFALWVLSPFMALVVAYIVSKRWSALIRLTLYTLMLVLPLVSVAIYADVAVVTPIARPAPVFVMVPPTSWVVIATILARAALISRRRRSDSA